MGPHRGGAKVEASGNAAPSPDKVWKDAQQTLRTHIGKPQRSDLCQNREARAGQTDEGHDAQGRCDLPNRLEHQRVDVSAVQEPLLALNVVVRRTHGKPDVWARSRLQHGGTLRLGALGSASTCASSITYSVSRPSPPSMSSSSSSRDTAVNVASVQTTSSVPVRASTVMLGVSSAGAAVLGAVALAAVRRLLPFLAFFPAGLTEVVVVPRRRCGDVPQPSVEHRPDDFGQRFRIRMTHAVQVDLSVRGRWLFEIREQPLERPNSGAGARYDDNIPDGLRHAAVRFQLRQERGRLRL